VGQSLGSGAGPPKVDDMEPPAYDVAIKLPTYEEAQQQKLASEQQHSVEPSSRFPIGDPRNYNFMPAFPHSENQFDSNTAELALGTDVYFFASFLSEYSEKGELYIFIPD
jgi:hypothetical protein